MTGWKLCTYKDHAGSRWVPVHSFSVQKWNEDKSSPKHLRAYCQACFRMYYRARRPKKPPKYKNQYDKKIAKRARERRNYRDRKDPRLPIEPFQQWLLNKVMESSFVGVASAVGVDAKRVKTLLDGLDANVNGKAYVIKHVRYSTVEKFTRAFGDHPNDVYHATVILNYKAYMHDGRIGGSEAPTQP